MIDCINSVIVIALALGLLWCAGLVIAVAASMLTTKPGMYYTPGETEPVDDLQNPPYQVRK